MIWRLLGTSMTPPEVVRADDALRQLSHPFVAIGNPTNRVLEWRLLFPLLGHGLHIGESAYLALPAVGALAVLCIVIGVVRRNGMTWPRATACATLLATSDWYFVSTGWLGYFDSWYVAALIVVVFARKHWVAMVAILLGTWIDERVVLTLPLCVFLRGVYLAEFGHGETLRIGQAASLFAPILPWLLIRIFLGITGNDDVPRSYLEELANAHSVIQPSSYIVGAWEGARLGWLSVAALLVLVWRRNPWSAFGLFAILVCTVAANLGVAQDLSRSASVIAPAVLLGLLLFPSQIRYGGADPILIVAAINILLPAEHVIGQHRIPILCIQTEMSRINDPLAAFNPRFFEDQGAALAAGGQDKPALEMFNLAIRLDPGFAQAISSRSLIEARLGELSPALVDADRALLLQPKDPGLWLNRGEMKFMGKDFDGAASDIVESIRLAPPPWPRLREAYAARSRAMELLVTLK
jgi:tetratricopeptide (TPR) repeat protein